MSLQASHVLWQSYNPPGGTTEGRIRGQTSIGSNPPRYRSSNNHGALGLGSSQEDLWQNGGDSVCPWGSYYLSHSGGEHMCGRIFFFSAGWCIRQAPSPSTCGTYPFTLQWLPKVGEEWFANPFISSQYIVEWPRNDFEAVQTYLRYTCSYFSSTIRRFTR